MRIGKDFLYLGNCKIHRYVCIPFEQHYVTKWPKFHGWSNEDLQNCPKEYLGFRHCTHFIFSSSYHPEFNPIERIWARGKQLVRRRNTSGNINQLKLLTENSLASIDAHYWKKSFGNYLFYIAPFAHTVWKLKKFTLTLFDKNFVKSTVFLKKFLKN